jgi:SOS response regulatory protein OraA/RecX
VVTPAKAKQELKKKGVDESVINGYYSKSRTTVKLVEDDGSKAKRVFGKLD